MEISNKKSNEFRIVLTVGSEQVLIGVPSGEGLANQISIGVGSTSSLPRCSFDRPEYNHEDPAPSIVPAKESNSSLRNESPSQCCQKAEEKIVEELEQGEQPIIPVDLDKDTSDTLDKNPTSLEEVFHTKYASKSHLYKHMCNALGKHVEFRDLTKPNLVRIKDWLAERVSPNTVVLYCSVIKACMNLYSDEGLFNCRGFSQVLKHKRVPSMNVYLNEEEIHKIEMYKPRNKCENDVKIKFLIEAYTGARLSDVERMTSNDIKDGYLTYISKKTNVLSKIPVHKNLEQLLEAKKSITTSRSIYSRTIKQICKNCGIDEETSIFYHGVQQVKPKWKFVGSHTARRSFATNLALRNVPIQVISKMMGHSGDTKMTEKYIMANIEAIDDNAMEFFK